MTALRFCFGGRHEEGVEPRTGDSVNVGSDFEDNQTAAELLLVKRCVSQSSFGGRRTMH